MVYNVKSPETANTLGEHIRKKRIEKGQTQKCVGDFMGLSKDTVTFWENNRVRPQVQHYPKIISYLGYYPFTHETETLAGKLRYVRYRNGWSFRECAKNLCISEDAAKRWERGKPVAAPKTRLLIDRIYCTIKDNTSV